MNEYYFEYADEEGYHVGGTIKDVDMPSALKRAEEKYQDVFMIYKVNHASHLTDDGIKIGRL
jgi:hypothetical protein